MGAKLKNLTAHYPQTDGQNEVTIRTVKNCLRPFVESKPSEWANKITTIKFSMNNAKT